MSISEEPSSSIAEAESPSLGPPVQRYERFLSLAGMVFVFLAVVCFMAIVILIILGAWQGYLVKDVTQFVPHTILIATGFLSALIARGLLTAGGRSDFSSFPERDFALIEEAIKKGEDEPITQYIRVRALSGFSGGFT